MNNSYRAIAALAVALSALGGAAVANDDDKRKFTAERVFDLEVARDPQISPDGRTIAYERTSMDRLKDRMRADIWTIDTRSGAHRPGVRTEGCRDRWGLLR